MTIKTAMMILEQHGIEFHIRNGVLRCLDVTASDGETVARWINCPMNRRDLGEWLGY